MMDQHGAKARYHQDTLVDMAIRIFAEKHSAPMPNTPDSFLRMNELYGNA